MVVQLVKCVVLLIIKKMKRSVLCGVVFMLFATTVVSGQTTTAGKTKTATAKTNWRNKVKIYPNPSLDGLVNITSNTMQSLHFYVFDLAGVLIHQVVLKGKQKYSLVNLKKGVYMYDVFLNDESVEGGKIIVK